MASRFRTIMDKICGLDERFEMLNERLTLIEQTIGINNFMSIGEGNVGNVGSGNVGVGSTVPPDVARYQELAAAQAAGNVGVGSTAPVGTTVTEPDTSVDGGQSTPASDPVGVGSTVPAIGVGSTVPAVGDGNVGDGNVGDGNV
jgi:hypothetical protein